MENKFYFESLIVKLIFATNTYIIQHQIGLKLLNNKSLIEKMIKDKQI